MNCSDIQDLAAALIDSEPLSIDELEAVETHLNTCSACRYEYEMERMTSLIVRARIPLVDTPEGTYLSILMALDED